jgi:glycosyltransferase involved in cell wall biosynthesis
VRDYLLFTGTDPESRAGGIGFVLPGYFESVRCSEIPYESIPTYSPNGMQGKFMVWLKALPKLARRIVGLKREGYDPVVYAHAGAGVSLLRECIVLLCARAYGARTVLQVHSCSVDRYLDRPWQKAALRLLFSPAQGVCVLTPWWGERLQQAGIRKTIHVIPNPMPPDVHKQSLQAREESRTEDGRTKVLFMTRLVKGKGADVAIRSMRHLPPDVTLVIAGDGEQREELEHLTVSLGLQARVSFTGWVAGEAKGELLRTADVFCLPTTYDAFPMSLIEAMSYGLPIVCVKWGGIPDIVLDQLTGILVDRADERLVAEAIGQLTDPVARRAMGSRGRMHALDMSSPVQVGKRIQQALSTLGA